MNTPAPTDTRTENNAWEELEITGMYPVEYRYEDGSDIDDRESEIEHIREQLLDGYVEGELNYFDAETGEDVSGWWRMAALHTNAEYLLNRAETVIENWEQGDLAAAVTELGIIVNQIKGD